jgi:hypothetical protein
MITITGLTDRQRTLMDLLWTCGNIEQVRELIAALPTRRDQQDAESLIHVATWESIEQELGFSKECTDAASRAIATAMR